MATPLRVLVLEDRPADAALAIHELEQAGFAPTWRRVETEADYAAALAPDLDLILADHSLPHYNAVKALARLRASGLDVPFVIVSGAIDEELAVTLMRQGAADYVFKDRLARLGPAVANALGQKRLRDETRRAEAQARASEARFRSLIEHSSDGISLVGADGSILYTGPSTTRMLGYPHDAFLGQQFRGFVHPDDWPAVQERFADLAGRPGGVMTHVCRVRHQDGSWRWLESAGTNLVHEANVGAIVVNFRDVTERRQAEEALRRSEERFRRITTNMLDMVGEVDAAGVLQYVTPSNQAVLGYRPEDMMGQSVFAFVHPEDVDRGVAEFQAGMQTCTPRQVELRYRHADGHYLWIETVGQPVFDDQGRPVGAILASRDVTARKRADEQLRLLTTGLEAAANGVVITDRGGNILWTNPAFTAMTGYTREEALAHNPRLLKSGLQDGAYYASLWEAILAGRVWHGELVNRRKDGTPYTEEMTITPVRADGRDVTHFIAVKQDVTERKRAEQALAESERRFREILENVQLIALMLDREGRVAYCNDYFLRLTGWQREEVLGQLYADRFLPPDVIPELMAYYRRFLAQEGVPLYRENPLRTRTGERLIFWNNTPWRDPQGAVLGVTAIGVDVTERKAAEEAARRLAAELEQRVRERTAELEAARDEADRANRAKSEFLSRMSHELRTPLNSILGFGQLLARGALPDKDRRRVEQVLKAGQHLLNLINEVLDIARIEAGRMHLSPEPVGLATLCQETAELLRPLAEQLNVRLEVQTIPGDCHVLADAPRLKQVLLNLLANGIKYNRPDGRVAVTCEAAPDGQVRLLVTDTGLGLDAGQLAHLFEPFNRLGAEQTAVEGTGLGLTLSRRLVEAMGGTLTVTSAHGRGSTFSVALPAATAPAARQARAAALAAPAPAGPHRTVLYVEDNLANLRLVEEILADRPGVRLLTALQAGIGLDLARQHHPDLILLDVHLPDFNGDELLLRLLGDPQTSRVPVAVLSADATPSQVERFRALGAREYLTKPLDVAHFLGVLDRLLEEPGSGSAATPTGNGGNGPGP